MSMKALAPLEKPVSATVETPQTPEIPAFTTEGLLALIANLLSKQDKATEGQAKLSEAILELAKPKLPLKTPEQLAKEENDKKFDDLAKELAKRQLDTRKQSQNNCPHIAGCHPLSSSRDLQGRTCILWHKTDAQAFVGICTNCGRYFYPNDPPDHQNRTYEYWTQQPSINRPSLAGNRQFTNPLKAMEDAYLRDER